VTGVLDSPFPYQGPLLPEQVRGRDGLLADLTERVTEHRVTALLGPRRYGKTSVLRRLAAELAAADTSIVWIDLYAIRSFTDLAMRLDTALVGATGPSRLTLDHLAAGFELNLGFIKANFQRPDRPAPEPTVALLLDVLLGAATRHPTLIVIDEFSGIDAVDGAAGLLRTKLQHHYQDIGLVFAGSEPSTMRSLFEDREQPFYAQADILTIDSLSAAAVHEIIAEGWGGDPPVGLASSIVEFTGGHPQRVMQLADAAWSITTSDPDVGPDLWGRALESVRASTGSGFEVRFDGLAPAQQAVLRIVASGGTLFGRSAELLDLNPSSTVDETSVIIDPLFADWLRRRLSV
jgi:hypothetical protein